MQNQTPDGTHDGTTKAATMYEADSGALMACFDVEVDNGPTLRGWITLVQKDGTLSERGFRDVQSILGWQAWDWNAWDQAPEAFAGKRVSVVLETVSDPRDGTPKQRIKYVNPPGAFAMQKGDAKAISAKYGAKLRALMGGAPAAAKPAALGGKPPAPVVPKPPVQVPTKAAVKPSSQDECWQKFCDANKGMGEADLGDRWFALLDRIVSGKAQTDFTPEDWGKVSNALEPLPF
jgi:hypothetical protein